MAVSREKVCVRIAFNYGFHLGVVVYAVPVLTVKGSGNSVFNGLVHKYERICIGFRGFGKYIF